MKGHGQPALLYLVPCTLGKLIKFCAKIGCAASGAVLII